VIDGAGVAISLLDRFDTSAQDNSLGLFSARNSSHAIHHGRIAYPVNPFCRKIPAVAGSRRGRTGAAQPSGQVRLSAAC